MREKEFRTPRSAQGGGARATEQGPRRTTGMRARQVATGRREATSQERLPR
jgi:hypothetical protein